MEFSPEMLSATANALSQSSNTASLVWDKISTIKKKGNDKETISNLEEIITDLINEKNELRQILQAFEEQFISQKITEDEIVYITEKVVPILEAFVVNAEGEDATEQARNIESLKPLLSKDTINILQLLGFNFKKAIGEPLTQLINSLIFSTQRKDEILQHLRVQQEIELFKVVQDPEAYERFLQMTGRK